MPKGIDGVQPSSPHGWIDAEEKANTGRHYEGEGSYISAESCLKCLSPKVEPVQQLCQNYS